MTNQYHIRRPMFYCPPTVAGIGMTLGVAGGRDSVMGYFYFAGEKRYANNKLFGRFAPRCSP